MNSRLRTGKIPNARRVAICNGAIPAIRPASSLARITNNFAEFPKCFHQVVTHSQARKGTGRALLWNNAFHGASRAANSAGVRTIEHDHDRGRGAAGSAGELSVGSVLRVKSMRSLSMPNSNRPPGALSKLRHQIDVIGLQQPGYRFRTVPQGNLALHPDQFFASLRIAPKLVEFGRQIGRITG